jgi:hypothetical protein
MAAQQTLYERPVVAANGTGLRAAMDDVLTLALRALSDKALFWTVTLGALGLWTFCAIKPEFWRMLSVGAYTVGVFLPMLWKAR